MEEDNHHHEAAAAENNNGGAAAEDAVAAGGYHPPAPPHHRNQGNQNYNNNQQASSLSSSPSSSLMRPSSRSNNPNNFILFPQQHHRSSNNPEQQQGNAADESKDADPEEHMESNSCGWSEVELAPNPGVAPSARSLHSAAVLNGVMYVFGGYDGNQRVNTFQGFSFADKRWSHVLPSTNSGPPPSPRDRHIAVTYGNSLFIHGGFDGQSRVGSFHQFDFSTMSWREIFAVGAPSARHSHAAAVHNANLYIFGGYDGSYRSDLYAHSFGSSQWNSINTVGRRPRPRYRSTIVAFKNSLILFGGHDGTRHLSDAHILDIETRTWTSPAIEGTPPIPRDSHVSVIHGNSMYVFGGSSGTAMNDLHELQLSSNQSGRSTTTRWRSVTTAREDQPRHRFCHVGVVHNDNLYIFGGYDGSDRLDDFIRFSFAIYDLHFEVPPSSLVSDFRDMINDSTLSDVTFVVEEQEIYAHKLMLVRCSYFQSLFLGPMKESTMSTIQIEQVRYPIFLSVLEYLYTDQLKIPLSIAMELFEAADLFCIPRLKTMCEKRMLQSISVETAASIFHAADTYSAAALRQKSKKYILSHFEEVSKTGGFEEMGRRNIDLVFEILHSR